MPHTNLNTEKNAKKEPFQPAFVSFSEQFLKDNGYEEYQKMFKDARDAGLETSKKKSSEYMKPLIDLAETCRPPQFDENEFNSFVQKMRDATKKENIIIPSNINPLDPNAFKVKLNYEHSFDNNNMQKSLEAMRGFVRSAAIASNLSDLTRTINIFDAKVEKFNSLKNTTSLDSFVGKEQRLQERYKHIRDNPNEYLKAEALSLMHSSCPPFKFNFKFQKYANEVCEKFNGPNVNLTDMDNLKDIIKGNMNEVNKYYLIKYSDKTITNIINNFENKYSQTLKLVKTVLSEPSERVNKTSENEKAVALDHSKSADLSKNEIPTNKPLFEEEITNKDATITAMNTDDKSVIEHKKNSLSSKPAPSKPAPSKPAPSGPAQPKEHKVFDALTEMSNMVKELETQTKPKSKVSKQVDNALKEMREKVSVTSLGKHQVQDKRTQPQVDSNKPIEKNNVM